MANRRAGRSEATMYQAQQEAPHLHDVLSWCDPDDILSVSAGKVTEETIDHAWSEFRMLLAENAQLHTELRTARDEMERQACLYAEASRHRQELRERLEAAEALLHRIDEAETAKEGAAVCADVQAYFAARGEVDGG